MIKRHALYRWLLFLIPLALFFSQPIGVGDLGIWIAQGLATLKAHALLRHDIFSAFPTKELVYPSWGISIVYALIYRLGGLDLVAILHPAAMMVLLWILYSNSIFRLKKPWSGKNRALVFFCLVGSIGLWTARPNFLSLFPLTLSFLILNKDAKLSKKDILRLCLLQILWVNLHGSFILLPGMLGWRALFGGRENRASNFAALALVFSSCLLNPFGVAVFPYVWETFTVSRGRIEEWQKTSAFLYFPTGVCFYLMVAGLALLSRKRLSVLRSPFFALICVGFVSIRFSALPTLLFLPFAYSLGLLTDETTEAAPASRVQLTINAAIVACWAAFAVMFNPYLKPRFAFLLPESKRPVYDLSAPFDVAARIRESSHHGTVFADWIYGSFLMLEQPNRIFLDTRNIIYSDSEVQEFTRIINGDPAWRDFFSRYGVDFVVLEKPRSNLANALSQDPAWTLSVENENTLLFQRK
jgi:hypothetical protein